MFSRHASSSSSFLNVIREHTFDRPQDLQDNLFYRLHLIHSSCRERRYRVRILKVADLHEDDWRMDASGAGTAQS